MILVKESKYDPIDRFSGHQYLHEHCGKVNWAAFPEQFPEDCIRFLRHQKRQVTVDVGRASILEMRKLPKISGTDLVANGIEDWEELEKVIKQMMDDFVRKSGQKTHENTSK